MMLRCERLLERMLTTEVLTFLAVGGTGYVVDVAVFNSLRSVPIFAAADPSMTRVAAVGAAMVVTYIGNRMFTWPGEQCR